MSLGSLIQPQVAGGSHLEALGQQQALADAGSSQPSRFNFSTRTVEALISTGEFPLLYNPFQEFQNTTRFWGGGMTRHRYIRVSRNYFSFDATEEAKYIQAHRLKDRDGLEPAQQLRYGLHEPSRYEDDCFDGRSTTRFFERRYPGENYCLNPGYLRAHREGGIRSENRRLVPAYRDADGVYVAARYENFLGRSPGWPGTDHRAVRAKALTFSEYLLTRNTERDRTNSQGGYFLSAIRANSDYLTNAMRKLGYTDLDFSLGSNRDENGLLRGGLRHDRTMHEQAMVIIHARY